MSRPDLQQALQLEAIRVRDQLPPDTPKAPAGQLQYSIMVGDSVAEGFAPPSVVAAILRAQADQLSRSKPHKEIP